MSELTLEQRIKQYEVLETQRKFIPMLPVYVRLDGRSFSKFTKHFNKPYDERMSRIMQKVTKYLVKETGATIGYTQSDEISLILYSDDIKSDIFFSYKVQKLVSIIASMCTVKFFQELVKEFPEAIDWKLPSFDCRIYQVPNKVEAMNCILWRTKDAIRNSLSMLAQYYFSHKSLLGKNQTDIHNMLHSIGINWANEPKFFKEGSFFKRVQFLKGDVIRHKIDEVIPETSFIKLDTDEKIELCFSNGQNLI